MLQGLIGKKIYQSQGFLQDGTRVPLSGVSALENTISQIKTTEKEGYNSVQISFDIKKKSNKALEGHSKKAGLTNTARFLKELRVDDVAGFELGTKLNINEILKPGDIIDVTGVSKGKGFAGGVKRWHFKGGPRTHGQSDRERAPGSIGQTTTPGRVYKGKRMAGKMGNATATVKNLEIIEITADGVILIKGLIPGPLNNLVMVKKVGENKKFVPLYKEVIEEKLEEIKQEKEEVQEPVEEKVEEEVKVEEKTEQPSKEEVSVQAQEAEVSVKEDVPAEEVKIEEVKENANS